MRRQGWLLLALALTWAAVATAPVQVETQPRRATTPGHNVGMSVVDIRDRLEAIAPFQMHAHAVGDDAIKTRVLCFCLHKGPHTVRALRRQAAGYFQQGLIALQGRNGVTAAAAFTKAIQLNPRDALAYVNRGLAYSQTGAFMKAHADLSRALAIDPRQPVAYFARGLIALLLGQAAAAQRDLRHAADLGEVRAQAVLKRLPAT